MVDRWKFERTEIVKEVTKMTRLNAKGQVRQDEARDFVRKKLLDCEGMTKVVLCSVSSSGLIAGYESI